MDSKRLAGMVCVILFVGVWAGLSAQADEPKDDQPEPPPIQAASLASILENPDFTLVTSETSRFSFALASSDIVYCGNKGVMSVDADNRQTNTLLESSEPGEYLWAWMSPDSKLLLVLTRKGKLLLADVGTGKKTALKENLPKGFKRCAFSPCGTYFVAIGGMVDSELLYWQVNADGNSVRRNGSSSLANCNTLYDCAFSPDEKILATVSGSGLVDFWSRPPMKPVRNGTSITRNGGLSGIAFSSDGKSIAVAASFEPIIALVSPITGEVVKRFDWEKGHPLSGRKLAFLPQSRILASADSDRISFLDTDSGRSLGSVPAGGVVKYLEVSPDGRSLVAGTRENTLVQWHLKE